MVNRKDLMSLGFYKLSPYTGSDGNMRYRIEKKRRHDKARMRGLARSAGL